MNKKESVMDVPALLGKIGDFIKVVPTVGDGKVKGLSKEIEGARNALASLRGLFSSINEATFACTEIRPLEKAGLVTMQLACTEVRPLEKIGVTDTQSAHVGARSAGNTGEEIKIELKCTEVRPIEKSASATLPLACTEVRPLEKSVNIVASHLTCKDELTQLKTQYEATVDLACTEVRPLEKTVEITAVVDP